MTNRQIKKVLAITISTAIVVGGINKMSVSRTQVKADTPKVNDINLGFGGISDPELHEEVPPVGTGTDDTTWDGIKVYCGEKLWRVLDADKGSDGQNQSAFLFLDGTTDSSKPYHNADEDVTWKDCDLRNYLNGTNNAGGDGTLLSELFTEKERCTIKTTTVTNEDDSSWGTESTDDKLFLLSSSEIQKLGYGFYSQGTRKTSNGKNYWLRTHAADAKYASVVDWYGEVSTSWGNTMSSSYIWVRPSFNINLSSVLFTSATAASKSDFGVVGRENAKSKEWKMTVKDGDADFDATLPAEGEIGKTIKVKVNKEGTGSYNQTSAILEDSTGSVVAYGKIGEAGTGDLSFTLPSTLNAGNYTLHVFEEQVNDGNKTDYASKEVTKDITISVPKTDAEKIAEAKASAQTAIGEVTATNQTTAQDYIDAVKAVVGTDIAVAMEGYSKTDATISATGKITGTIKLSLGTEEDSLSVSTIIAKLVSPSASPSATPSAKPSVTPSAKPSATPSAKPKANNSKLSIKKVSVKKIKAKIYTGYAIKPKLEVAYNGKKLKKTKDYTVSYRNNKKVGTAKAIIKGAGKYTGSTTINFKIKKRPAKYYAPGKYRLTAGVNVRKTHSSQGEIIGSLRKGNRVKVTKVYRNGNANKKYTWLKISYKGKKAYIYALYTK